MLIIFVRAIVLYISVIISMRVLGKRQLGELEASELAVTILVSELAALPMQDTEIPLIYGLVPIVVIIALEMILMYGAIKNIRLRVLLFGKPSIIIQNGEVIQKEVRKNRLTIDELTETLRTQNVTDISTVKYAILETNGQISTILYANQNPITAQQMNLGVDENGMPIIIISDGRFLSENMRIRNVDKTWIESYLQKNNFPSSKDIFLMTLDDTGNVYVIVKDGSV